MGYREDEKIQIESTYFYSNVITLKFKVQFKILLSNKRVKKKLGWGKECRMFIF